MAVPKKNQKQPSGHGRIILERIIEYITDLWETHQVEILDLAEESENDKVTVNFTNEIDFAESEPALKTKIRFTRTVTDNRSGILNDPNQPGLGGIDSEAAAASAEARRKHREETEAAKAGAAESGVEDERGGGKISSPDFKGGSDEKPNEVKPSNPKRSAPKKAAKKTAKKKAAEKE